MFVSLSMEIQVPENVTINGLSSLLKVYVGIEPVALGSLAIGGIIALAIPAVMICFPCLYVAGLIMR